MFKGFPGEVLLIKVVKDLKDFLPCLVLVGGWVPYIYARYIWKHVPILAVTTGDIDFGVGVDDFAGDDTVSLRVRRLGYGERHVSMDMLRFSPGRKRLTKDVIAFITKRPQGPQVRKNLLAYFSDLDSKGPLLVEQENGPDDYVDDVRFDAFERFSEIIRGAITA